ncbi:MAG: GNAT family N-acetyltransferase [Lachnospiraceae bacterium]|nr:GNAT family N-acetyltransferase [Lachnospiraceae bacterium]
MLPKLETKRLRMQCLTNESAFAVLEFYKENQPYFDQYELTRPRNFYTVSYHTAALDWELKEMEARRCLRYFVFLKEEPSMIIGSVNVSDIRFGCMQKASFGYKFDHRFWHQGYAYEACTSCLDFIFRDYGLHRMEANIMPSNQASIRLIQRLGFSYEGTEKESAEINHRWEDLHRFAKLNPYTSSTIQ